MFRSDALAFSLRAGLDRIVPALARACAAFHKGAFWRTFGYARSGDHARERFGRSGRWLRDLAALGSAFERLPSLADAVAGTSPGGSIGRVAASIIACVASPESLEAWLVLARTTPVRLLREVAGRARKEGSAWPDQNMTVSPGDFRSGVDGRTSQPEVTLPSCREVEHPGKSNEDDPSSDGVLVRLLVPAPVAAAFDEILDLYRAVAGSQTTVTEFVEALVADSEAGPHPADAHAAPLGSAAGLREGEVRALREKALARSTRGWEHLSDNDTAAPDWSFALAGMSLAALEDLTSRAGQGGSKELDAQIRALIRLEDDLERRLAGVLADMADQNAWARLRFDSVGHYAEQRLGMSRSSAQDRVRAVRGLSHLPIVKTAYEGGHIGLDAALLLVRVLERGGSEEEKTQEAWVRRAMEASVKRLRDEERLTGRWFAMGSRSDEDSQGDAAAQSPATTCLPPDDAAWQRSLRRQAGSTRRRIALLGEIALESPAGDVFFRLRLPSDLASAFLSSVESARSRLARIVEEVPWDQPWPTEHETGEGAVHAAASLLCARMFSIRCRRSPAWVGLLALLEEFCRTWDDPEMSPERQADAVYIRDGWRCTAPGCTSRRNLEDHHIVYRSRGGNDDLSNRTCLCRFHHQMGEHGGLARCRGVAPMGVLWALGRGGAGGRWRNEIRAG